ncbi:MAG: hypothetical protein R2760_08035 [Chitinophagales bacterium]
MSEYTPCPKCKSEYTYFDEPIMLCPEWNPTEERKEDGLIVRFQ